MNYEKPRPGDEHAMARLFAEDMADLGVSVGLDELEGLAAEVIAEAGDAGAVSVCWVARLSDGDGLCGVVLANTHWSLKFGGRALWIEELYVTPDYRRQGVGRALVGKVVDFGRSHGFRGIDLEAYRGNTPASVLYRTMGFHRLGRERFYMRLEGDGYL